MTLRHKNMTTTKLTLSLIITLLVILAATLLHAQTGQEAQEPSNEQAESYGSHNRWRELQAQRIEGSWDSTFTLVGSTTSARGYKTFARGGAYIASIRPRPFGTQHGTWAHLGGNRFAFTALEDRYDATGAFIGTVTVRARLTLTGRNEMIGVFSSQVYDANGVPAPTQSCGTTKATRITVEPLADQCQNITPPQ